MGGLASVLPFLAALKKAVPDASGFVGENNVPGSTATGSEAAWTPDNINAPSRIPTNPQMLPSPMGPPEAPPDPASQPDMSVGVGQQPPADLASAPTGKAAQPHLSKATMLVDLLRNGIQGAAAGYAQNAQTYAQTGRNAGFGGGFYGASQLPFMQAYQRGQLAQQGAQTELLKQQANEINVPGYGTMPAGLAKVLFPSLIRGQATETAATTRAGGTTQAAQIGANARIQAAQMGLGPIADVPQDLQDQFGLPGKLPLKMLNQAESAANKPLTTVQGAGGPAVVNKQTKQTTSLGLGAPALARPVVVADPNNPGNLTYASAAQAERQGAMAPGAAPVVAAKGEARSEVPTKIGDQRVAFNTMIQHAQLLRQAAAALNNGDVQALAGLKNQFKNQFGWPGPITAEAIADAYKGEVSNVINKGHITDAGNEKVAHTLDPTRQNYQTVDSVLSAYQGLAQSKLNMLNQQANVARGQPAAQQVQAGPPAGASHAVIVNGKIVGYTSDGKTMTPAP